MSNKEKIIEENDIKWCAEDNCFYVNRVKVSEVAFIRYAKLVWNISLEDVLVSIKNSKRILLKSPVY